MEPQQQYWGHSQYRNFAPARAFGMQEQRREQLDMGHSSPVYQQQEQNVSPGTFVNTSFAQPSRGPEVDPLLL